MTAQEPKFCWRHQANTLPELQSPSHSLAPVIYAAGTPVQIVDIPNPICRCRWSFAEEERSKSTWMFCAPIKQNYFILLFFASAGQNSTEHGVEELICISL